MKGYLLLAAIFAAKRGLAAGHYSHRNRGRESGYSGTQMKHATLVLMLALTGCLTASAQTILTIVVDNYVPYHDDVADPAMFASNPNTKDGTPRVFQRFVFLGDIVSVNGQPAKGIWTANNTSVLISPTPPAKQSIGDAVRTNTIEMYFDVLLADGTPVGMIVATGLTRGLPPPGAPKIQTGDTMAIIGGTGAFLGVRGQAGVIDLGSPRQASMVEDPANRRTNGGARRSYVLHLIPMTVPEIVTTSTGPAVVHSSDNTLVSADRPGRAGEVLTLYASGLGPTRPGVDPGNGFPFDGLQVVNSPLQVSVNGTPTQILYAGGYPGAIDRYQVNLRLPDDVTPGLAALSLSAAWISGPQARIPVQ